MSRKQHCQENEADDYAFSLILQTPYDPAALGNSFANLQPLESYYRHPLPAEWRLQSIFEEQGDRNGKPGKQLSI